MDEDELALVSSLYGKGTTFCWLFTILACLILWACDERKRKCDTLDADFIGILALPSVAAGHTIYQIRCLKSLTFSDIKPVKITQLSRAIEASLTVTETFMILSVVLFLVAFPARCYKRAVLVALTGLFCLATEYVVYSQLTRSPSQHLSNIRANFTRSFVSDSAIITAVILILILACIAIAFCLALYVFYSTPPRPLETSPEEAAAFARNMSEIESLHTPEAVFREMRRNRTRHGSREDCFMYLSFWIALIPLVASVGTTNMSIFIGVQSLNAQSPKSSGWWSGLGHVIQQFLAAFFPKTAAGFSDLDQAVALATGCIILALSLWSVGRKWYVEWKLEREARLREQRTEDIRLTELRRRLAVLVQEAR